MLREYLTNIGLEWKPTKNSPVTINEFVQEQLIKDSLMKSALAKRDKEKLNKLLKASLKRNGTIRITDNELLLEKLGLPTETNELPLEVVGMIVVSFTSGLTGFDFRADTEALERWVQAETKKEEEKKVDRKTLIKRLLGRQVPQEDPAKGMQEKIYTYTTILNKQMVKLDIHLDSVVEEFAAQKVKEVKPRDALKKGEFLTK